MIRKRLALKTMSAKSKSSREIANARKKLKNAQQKSQKKQKVYSSHNLHWARLQMQLECNIGHWPINGCQAIYANDNPKTAMKSSCLLRSYDGDCDAKKWRAPLNLHIVMT